MNNDIKELNELLDKMVKVQEHLDRPSFLKKIIYVVGGICAVAFIALICTFIYKKDFSIEAIFATLLAFFSIFISIFFYFKADQTSNRFYDSSYKFMKDISVTLGKIEERFGEKLNSLNEKVSHLDLKTIEADEEIQDKTDDRIEIINQLLNKANIDEEEKERFRIQIAEKDKEIERLRVYRDKARREAMQLRRKIQDFDEENDQENQLSDMFLKRLLETQDVSKLSKSSIHALQKLGVVGDDGEVDNHAILRELRRRS